MENGNKLVLLFWFCEYLLLFIDF